MFSLGIENFTDFKWGAIFYYAIDKYLIYALCFEVKIFAEVNRGGRWRKQQGPCFHLFIFGDHHFKLARAGKWFIILYSKQSRTSIYISSFTSLTKYYLANFINTVNSGNTEICVSITKMDLNFYSKFVVNILFLQIILKILKMNNVANCWHKIFLNKI